MALDNFFKINLPYGVRGSKKKGWFAFNREYKPLGFNKCSLGDQVKYDDYPIFTKYKRMNSSIIKKISEMEGSIVQESEDETVLFLYDDGNNPSNTGKERDWKLYFKKLKMLATLKYDEYPI